MPSVTPQTRPAAPRAPAVTTAQAPRRLGLVLAVIATAQLMVVLDLTIVNVALPHIQAALGFSGSNLEWVVNAYAVAFGGLLLLGGRAGDLLERRRVFIAGLLVFSLASLLGGFATGQAWLITARAVQGAGAAMAAPTALSLIAVTFPEGRPRNRAVAVYSAMAILGIVVGLIAGGLLVTYASWHWVFFVNVPIGLAVAALAGRVLPTVGAARRAVRPARRDHRDGRRRVAGIRAVQRGDHPGRRLALGRHQGDRLAGRRGGAAGVVRGDRDPQQARAAADAAAAQPGPVRGVPDQLVRRYRAARHVLLPDRVHPGGVGVQPAVDGGRLPAVRPRDLGDDGGRAAGGEQDRRPAAADRRQRARGQRDVLAVPDQRAQHLRRRDARPDAGPRGRPGPGVRVRREDLSGADPAQAGDTSSPNPAEARETHHRVMAIQPAGTLRRGPGKA